ncbi:MAG: pyridoxal phosphate-dependent aminotransferase [Rickettsiales bacterium]|jgi:aspartate aminotransferase|nr:pyridoxal phosphate-dependent aminotransferase [Rickettsiales bacterium]
MELISNNLKNNIKPSPTLIATAKANELKARGYPVISLCAGEPDFNTPEHIKRAGIDAINQGYTKYTAAGGGGELKEAITNKFKRENNLSYKLNEVCASSGAKQSIFNAFMATLNPGDEVIIPVPHWVSYPEMVKIAGGNPVILKGKNFNLDIQEIEKSITSKTKWMMINSPSNPSGITYSKQALRDLADLLLKHKNIHVLSDDIYEHLVYDQTKFYNLAQIEPKLKDRILIVNGLSKTYAMTGWRIGYAAGPASLIKAMTTIQSQSTSSPCSISQKAGIAALNGPQDFIEETRKIFTRRRNIAHQFVNEIPGLKCDLPQGTFYMFINCSDLFGKKTPDGKIINNSNDFVIYLLEQVYLAVVDGTAFGVEGYFRISYATSDEQLRKGCELMKKACEMLS